MEGLLLALLIGLITSFLNKKDGQKANEAKPFMPQKKASKETVQTHTKQKPARSPGKTLEDFTRDVMAQLQTKEQPKAKEAAETVQQAVAERAERKPIETRVNERQQSMREVKQDTESSFTVPTTRQSLQQAIIMAEILGQPKAKKRL